jgi:hypothetical protein
VDLAEEHRRSDVQREWAKRVSGVSGVSGHDVRTKAGAEWV